jgi:hypothetical protein
MTLERPARRRAAWLSVYYIATPLFAWADWLGFNVRAVGLAGHPEWRIGYYVACTAIGLGTVSRPSWSPLLGVLESAVNILLLVLAVLAPYYDTIEVLSHGGTPAGPALTPGFFLNFLLSAGVGLTEFRRAQASLRGARSPRNRN